MSGLFGSTLPDALNELKREKAKRPAVYKRLIAVGRLREDKARRQMEDLDEAIRILEVVKAHAEATIVHSPGAEHGVDGGTLGELIGWKR